jgi:hypothetical protein
MVINAVCPHCKRVYPVDEQYAGQTFSCETCGNPFTVPVPGVVQPVRTVAAVPSMEDSGALPGEISRNRRLSARICFVLCGLLYIGAFCCAFGGVIFLLLPNAGAGAPKLPLGVISVICFALGIFNAVVATIYLISGIYIRKGSFVWTIIALILASIHALLILFVMVAGAVHVAFVGFRDTTPGEFAFGMALYGIFLLALAQLIYYLVKALRESRSNA